MCSCRKKQVLPDEPPPPTFRIQAEGSGSRVVVGAQSPVALIANGGMTINLKGGGKVPMDQKYAEQFIAEGAPLWIMQP